MPVNPTYPGVYIEEIKSGVHTITGVATSITAFLGRAARGPVNEAVTINSYADFERIFGGLWEHSTLGFAVRDFYLNGGSQAIIVRLYSPYFINAEDRQVAQDAVQPLLDAAKGAAANIQAIVEAVSNAAEKVNVSPVAVRAANAIVLATKSAANKLNAKPDDVKSAVSDAAASAFPVTKAKLNVAGLPLEAANEGSWGEYLEAYIDFNVSDAVAKSMGLDDTDLFNLTVIDNSGGQTELFRNLTLRDSPLRIDKVLKDQSDLVRWVGDLDQSPVTEREELLASAKTQYDSIPTGQPQALFDEVQTKRNVSDAARKKYTYAIAKQAQSIMDKYDSGSFDKAQAEVDKKQQAVDEAKKGLEEAEATGNSDDINRAQDALNTANTNLANAQTARDALTPIGIATKLRDDAQAKMAAATTAQNKDDYDKALIARDNAQAALDALNSQQDMIQKKNAADNAKPDAQKAVDGNWLTVEDFTGNGTEANKLGLYALEQADLFNILCIPPYLPTGDVDVDLVSAAAAYCERRRALLLVDPPHDWLDKDRAKTKFTDATIDNVGTRSSYAALFFPRFLQPNPLHNNQVEEFVPCGAVAGIFARTDVQRGVWKAPAGIDASLVGVPQLTVNLTDLENGELNPLGINCLRSFPIYGRVVWGSRTLRGADQFADDYKYIPVRRTALFIEESLYRGTKWVVFEPNDEPLWAQIRLNVGAFMHNLFRQGAFQGQTPRDAYLVKCDKETTTQNDIDLGIVNILVAFAPLKPAEFVIIQIQQMAGQIEV